MLRNVSHTIRLLRRSPGYAGGSPPDTRDSYRPDDSAVQRCTWCSPSSSAVLQPFSSDQHTPDFARGVVPVDASNRISAGYRSVRLQRRAAATRGRATRSRPPGGLQSELFRSVAVSDLTRRSRVTWLVSFVTCATTRSTPRQNHRSISLTPDLVDPTATRYPYAGRSDRICQQHS